jgi:phosphoglycolate phosphatase
MHVFFDLDGTLTDSREGIVRCIQHALRELGAEVPDDAELLRYVGPPLMGTFATLLDTVDAGRVQLAIGAYRQRFERIGLFENAVFPGIQATLTALGDAGHTMSVVTSKPHVYARRILEHFGLAPLFRGVYGPELANRAYTKGTLIAEACARAGMTAGDVVMVGDRAEDILGAREQGAAAIGVLWGYGGAEELEAARPDAIVASPVDLVTSIATVSLARSG